MINLLQFLVMEIWFKEISRSKGFTTSKCLNHIFSRNLAQFCERKFEGLHSKSTCFVRDLQGNDLLTGNRGTDLYTISLQETTSSAPICLMAKASPTQAWLWHRRLSHLNFDYINLLSKKDVVIGLPKLKYVNDQLFSSCEFRKAKPKFIQVKDCSKFERTVKFASYGLMWSNAGCKHQWEEIYSASPTQAWLWHQRLSHLNFDYLNLLSKKDVVIGLPKMKYVKDQLCSFCEVSKANRSSFKTKDVLSSKGRLNLLHMDLCGPVRVASINGKKYILVIIDDYYRYTSTLFLRSKDETPEVLKDFLTMIQRNLQALVISVRTERGTEFLNKTLNAFFEQEGIEHQTSTPRTPEQNGIVERRNRTLVEAARTMLSASKLPLDGENLDKMKEKGDPCILASFPNDKKASDYDNSGPDPQLQNVSPSADTTVPSQQELDLLFSPLYDEFFNADTSQPSTPTHVNAEENNNDQAEFTNPFCTPVQEVAESSSHNIAEPKNIKEAMADSAWIEAMLEELHQFDRL
ncbi:retrovirus-related pol polyprotein from transposon TNT 1-94 [Tanacetum coccineum]